MGSLNPRGQISLHIYMPLLDIKKKTDQAEKNPKHASPLDSALPPVSHVKKKLSPLSHHIVIRYLASWFKAGWFSFNSAHCAIADKIIMIHSSTMSYRARRLTLKKKNLITSSAT